MPRPSADRVPATDPRGLADPARGPLLRLRSPDAALDRRVRRAWPILLNALYGARGVDRVLHDVARTSVSAPRPARSRHASRRAPEHRHRNQGQRLDRAARRRHRRMGSGTDGVGAYMQRQGNAFQLPELYAAVVLVGASATPSTAGCERPSAGSCSGPARNASTSGDGSPSPSASAESLLGLVVFAAALGVWEALARARGRSSCRRRARSQSARGMSGPRRSSSPTSRRA